MLLEIDGEMQQFDSTDDALQVVLDSSDDVREYDGWTPELFTHVCGFDVPFSSLPHDRQMELLRFKVMDNHECEGIATEACEAERERLEREENPPADVHPSESDRHTVEVRDRIHDRVNEDAFDATCGNLLTDFVEDRQDYTTDLLYDLWSEYDPR